jgi:signal recognition particle subunit SEC65
MASAIPAPGALISKWQGIYPIYINAKKTVAEGRRLSIPKSVDNPTMAEIEEVVKFLKVPYVVEACDAIPCFVCVLTGLYILAEG